MKKEPYSDINKWKKIVYVCLYIFITFVIIFITFIVTIIALEENMIDSNTVNYIIDLGINILASSLAAVGVSIFIYFKFLKRIPDENRKKIDELLNDRLGHETANHNAVLQNLNPSNSELSQQHRDILRNSSEVKELFISEKEKNEYRQSLLTSEQKDIKKQIQAIQSLEKQMEQLQERNHKLEIQNSSLKQQIQLSIKSRNKHINRNDFEPKL